MEEKQIKFMGKQEKNLIFTKEGEKEVLNNRSKDKKEITEIYINPLAPEFSVKF